jgi:hypothetical protein
MKLQVGKFLIETDYIEMVDRMSEHTVKLCFLSGKSLDVVCGIKTVSASAATWPQDADAFIQVLQNIEKPGQGTPH